MIDVAFRSKIISHYNIWSRDYTSRQKHVYYVHIILHLPLNKMTNKLKAKTYWYEYARTFSLKYQLRKNLLIEKQNNQNAI